MWMVWMLKAVIKELRSAGFTVAIDDFRTEYANLSLLSEVDFDILKAIEHD